MKCPVHIIESPSPDDFYDDTREGPLLVEGLRLISIPPKYCIAINKDMLVKALDEVIWDDISLGPPILHLSMHGDEDGVILSDGSRVKWDELRSYLIPINKRLRGLLLVCMSSCKGFNGFKMVLRSNEDVPFRLLIGSTEEIALSDLAFGFMTFYYQLLFKSKDENEAIEAMRVSSGNAFFFSIPATAML